MMADAGERVRDERLRLVLLCAHPALEPEAAAALSLRLVLGVSTADIARLFLVPVPTMAARLTRARKRLARERFELPSGAELDARVATAADVAYLAFTAGYAPASGPDLLRPDLAGEAVRLVRMLRELAPGRSELDALLALVLLQHARRDARVGPDGELVLLPDQDRSLWHHDEITEALVLLTPRHGRAARAVPPAGAGRRGARCRTPRAGHRLDADRDPLRRARAPHREPGRPAQPGRRGRGGRRPPGRAGAARGAGAAGPPAAGGPGRAAGAATGPPTPREAYDEALALCANEAEARHLAARRALL